MYFGQASQLGLQAPYPVNIVVPKGRNDDVKIDLRVSPYYEAPIQVGQSVGVASVSLDGELLIDVPLVAMSSIEEGGIWIKLKDSIRLWLRDFWDE